MEDDLGGEGSMIARIEIEIADRVDNGEGAAGAAGEEEGPPVGPPGGGV